MLRGQLFISSAFSFAPSQCNLLGLIEFACNLRLMYAQLQAGLLPVGRHVKRFSFVLPSILKRRRVADGLIDTDSRITSNAHFSPIWPLFRLINVDGNVDSSDRAVFPLQRYGTATSTDGIVFCFYFMPSIFTFLCFIYLFLFYFFGGEGGLGFFFFQWPRID